MNTSQRKKILAGKCGHAAHFSAKIKNMSTKDKMGYYEQVVKGLRNLEQNSEMIRHLFIETEPEEMTPKHARAMDIDKATGLVSEFINNVRRSIAINANRVWQPVGKLSDPTDSIRLPSPDSLEQPLSYDDPRDADPIEF